MKPANAKTYVVIPNYNGIDWIRECLDSLRQQTLKHTVIVVDNGSKDGSFELIRDHYPEVQLHGFPNNAGFSGGVNRGIRPALEQEADYIALLNNDAIADEKWLQELVRCAEEHPEAGIVTSKILRLDRKLLDSTGDFYTSWGFSYPRGRDEVDSGQYDGLDCRTIFSASGGASLYRSSMLREIGIFDEAFFAYYEDVDLSFRAHLAGWEVRYEPEARVYHHVNATSSRMKNNFARFHTVKNFIYLYTKNMPGWLYWKYLPKFWLAYGMFVVRDITRLRLGATIRGTLTAWGHLPAALRERRKIQRSRKVSVAQIDAMLEHEMPPTQKTYLQLKNRLQRRSAAK